MNITIHYPNSGHTRTHNGITQAAVNKMITSLSEMNEEQFIPVKITVTDDKKVN